VSARLGWLLGALVLVAGCPAPLQYREVRPGLSCERATRVAHRALVELGYTVTDLVVATPVRAGVVAARKTQPDGTRISGRVVITCDGQGAQLQPVEDGFAPTYEFSRGFGYSFNEISQPADASERLATA
jgi:hypothetical protein